MKVRIIRELGGLAGNQYKKGDVVEAQVAVGGVAQTVHGRLLSANSYVPHVEMSDVNEWAEGLRKEEHG